MRTAFLMFAAIAHTHAKIDTHSFAKSATELRDQAFACHAQVGWKCGGVDTALNWDGLLDADMWGSDFVNLVEEEKENVWAMQRQTARLGVSDTAHATLLLEAKASLVLEFKPKHQECTRSVFHTIVCAVRAAYYSPLAKGLLVVSGIDALVPPFYTGEIPAVITGIAGTREWVLCKQSQNEPKHQQSCQTHVVAPTTILYIPPYHHVTTSVHNDLHVAVVVHTPLPFFPTHHPERALPSHQTHSQQRQQEKQNLVLLWDMDCTLALPSDTVFTCTQFVPFTQTPHWKAVSHTSIQAVPPHDQTIPQIQTVLESKSAESVQVRATTEVCHVGDTCSSLGLSGTVVSASSCECDDSCGCDESCNGCCGCDGWVFGVHDCGCDCWGPCTTSCGCDDSCQCDVCTGCFALGEIRCGETSFGSMEPSFGTVVGTQVFKFSLRVPTFVTFTTCLPETEFNTTIKITQTDMTTTVLWGDQHNQRVRLLCDGKDSVSGLLQQGDFVLMVSASHLTSTPKHFGVAWTACSPNECQTNQHGCDELTACHDTATSYECSSCPTGFTTVTTTTAPTSQTTTTTTTTTTGGSQLRNYTQCVSLSELTVFSDGSFDEASSVDAVLSFHQPIFVIHRILPSWWHNLGDSPQQFVLKPTKLWVQDLGKNITVALSFADHVIVVGYTLVGVKLRVKVTPDVLRHGLDCTVKCVLAVQSELAPFAPSPQVVTPFDPTNPLALSTIGATVVRLPFSGVSFPPNVALIAVACVGGGIVLLLLCVACRIYVYPPKQSHQRMFDAPGYEIDQAGHHIELTNNNNNNNSNNSNNNNNNNNNHDLGIDTDTPNNTPNITPTVGPQPTAPLMTSSSSSIENLICQVCYNHHWSCTFGCGHVVCKGCAKSLQICPFCRNPVTKVIKLHP